MPFHRDFQQILEELVKSSDYIYWSHRTSRYMIRCGGEAHLFENNDSINIVVNLFESGVLIKNYRFENPYFPKNLLDDIEEINKLRPEQTIKAAGEYLIDLGFGTMGHYRTK